MGKYSKFMHVSYNEEKFFYGLIYICISKNSFVKYVVETLLDVDMHVNALCLYEEKYGNFSSVLAITKNWGMWC